MKRFEDLNQEDKNEVVCKAHDWQREHKAHVDRLVDDASCWYAPSGSDMHHPERWKPAHWKWFERGGE